MNAPPLRKKKKGGHVYTRFQDVEACINELYKLGEDDLVARCKLTYSAQGYVPTQCLAHFVRHRRHAQTLFKHLFEILASRMRKIRPAKLIPDFEDHAIESAFDQFWMLVALEIREYQERLDYFEVNFKGAYAALILDEQRRHSALASHFSDLPDDDGEASDDAQSVFDDSVLHRVDLNLRWKIARERMTHRQRLAVKWHRQGLPVETTDPNEPCISKLLGVTPKTIRTDLAKAYALFKQLSEEGAHV